MLGRRLMNRTKAESTWIKECKKLKAENARLKEAFLAGIGTKVKSLSTETLLKELKDRGVIRCQTQVWKLRISCYRY